ncbi:hypothetical protein Pelo_18989 [Pelomyxa schiedti]|nr:hypothetical protein Pelo_18989 [Pelomyxa schiedti]
MASYQQKHTPALTPEAIINQGNPLPTTQGDVWNSGILVHNVIAPLSFVALESTSSSRPLPHGIDSGPRKVLSVPETTSPTSPAAELPEQQDPRQDNRIEVETVPQVAHAIAGGEFVVDTDTLTTTAASHGDQRALLPLWARQVISCCLVAEPSLRPQIYTLINIWGHFS